MSKLRFSFPVLSATAILLLLFYTSARAQDLVANVTIKPERPEEIHIEGSFRNRAGENRTRNLSFLLDYAGIQKLGERVRHLKLSDNAGNETPWKEVIPGEYLANVNFDRWSYRMLIKPSSPESAAHVSWTSGDHGILMAGDLLPIIGRTGNDSSTAQITFDLPEGWPVYSTEQRTSAAATFETADVSRAIFVIGNGWRQYRVNAAGTFLDILVRDSWLFTDQEFSEMVSEIYGRYRKIFGDDPATKTQIVLSKSPTAGSQGMWQAETRGKTVLILSSDMAFRTQSLQRLHEQLRHEIFHLWIPNGVNLGGKYDWFYEGFGLYMSLKLAVSINRIRFDDFLDTLSRALNIDSRQSPRQSLIQASNARWSGSDLQVYARGLIVAFLSDISLLERSRGKISAADLVKRIYEKHKTPSGRQDGNAAALAVMEQYKELIPLTEKYIKGSESIDSTAFLVAGIRTGADDRRSRLEVSEKLSGRQKAVLDKLGYNNWRKLSEKPR